LISVIGLQVFSGLFLKRCINFQYGNVHSFNDFTTLCLYNTDCNFLNNDIPDAIFKCSKTDINPNFGLFCFDNIFNSLIIIFQLVSMQSCTTLFSYLSRTFHDDYYISGIIKDFYIFGGNFVLCLVVFFYIAILKSNFSLEQRIFEMGRLKPNLAELILKNDTTEDKIEEKVYIEKDDKYIPGTWKTCRDLQNLKLMDPQHRHYMLLDIEEMKNKCNNEEENADEDDEDMIYNDGKKPNHTFSSTKNVSKNYQFENEQEKKRIKFLSKNYSSTSSKFNEFLPVVKEKALLAFKLDNENFQSNVMLNPIFKILEEKGDLDGNDSRNTFSNRNIFVDDKRSEEEEEDEEEESYDEESSFEVDEESILIENEKRNLDIRLFGNTEQEKNVQYSPNSLNRVIINQKKKKSIYTEITNITKIFKKKISFTKLINFKYKRSISIKKSKVKYQSDPNNQIYSLQKNKKKDLLDLDKHLQSNKHYYRYIYNIIDKDFEINPNIELSKDINAEIYK